MSKKNTKPPARAAQPPQPNEPQRAPVAVLTITYAPPLQRVIAVQPAFPLQMSFDDVLTILRAAEQQLIADAVLAQAQRETSKTESELK